jgi:phosphoserine phosphatase
VIASRINRVERMDWLEKHAGTPSTSVDLPPNQSVIDAREEMVDWYIEAGREAVDSFLPFVTWAEGAHTGVKSLIDNGFLVAIASLTWSFGVERIAADLGITELTATHLDWDSKQIDHIFAEDKATFLQKMVAKYEISRDRVWAVGDSGGDIPMLKAAGHGVFVGDSDPQISGVVHLPAAGIDAVAKLVLRATD